MKLLFLGTPEFAVPSLRALVAAGHDVRAVLCRADKPSGRGLAETPPPVKVEALRHGLPVLQPKKLKDPALAERLKALEPEVVVVVAYGLLIPKWFLELAPFGCVNVHGSILPRLRGAAPLQHAILEGFSTSGISLMKLDEGMDTGPVYETFEVPLGPRDTTGELHDRLAALSEQVLPAALERIVGGQVKAEQQDDSKATLAPKLPVEMERLRFGDPAWRVDRIVRTLSPRPGAYAIFRGKRLKLLRSAPAAGSGKPGELLAVESGHTLRVACGEGALEVLELQPEGKRPMSAGQFLAGHRLTSGETFETAEAPAQEAKTC
ncbi:MAG: methionyl-tRNA formyltransferase [Candidatus Wallbacteria bacterium]|nr:methionyl-tRNA formyltransferase [Candidatus Wallbacteria bacterium]